MVRSRAMALLHDGRRYFICEIVTATGASSAGPFTAIAEESALDQHGRISRFSKDPEVCSLDPAIHRTGQRHQILLNSISQIARDGGVIIGLKAPDAAPPRIVEMNADENGVVLAVRDRGPFIEGNKGVVGSSHHDAEVRLD